jgi:hypothetical protein
MIEQIFSGEPLESNWPYKDERPRQPKKREIWFVYDESGFTVGEFSNSEAAYFILEKCCDGKGMVKEYNPSPEKMDSESAKIRSLKRYQRGFGA